MIQRKGDYRMINGALAVFLVLIPSLAQAITPEEHASHHPGSQPPAQNMASQPPSAGGMPMGAGPGSGGGAMGGGGMMEGMGEMMKEMGNSGAKEFHPSLMDLPALTEEQKATLEAQAQDRMKTGAKVMNRAIMDLTHAAEQDDYLAMQGASALLREGLAQFDSGVSTRRALMEGNSPQQIGLNWFKQNLSLSEQAALSDPAHRGGLFGLSLFHFFVMLSLLSFAAVMIGMYFLKMRRATKLLERLISPDAAPSTARSSVASHEQHPEGIPSLRVEEHSHPKATESALPTRWKGKLKVASIFQETPLVKTFHFVSPGGGRLPFTYEAGQFLTLGVTVDGKPLKRAYSITSHPCQTDAIELTIKREDHGLVSRFMHDFVKEGDTLDVETAFGSLTLSGLGERPLVLIGGGVGITPLMAVLRCMISCGMKNPIHLLYACKTLQDFVFKDELEYLQKRNPNLKLTIAVDHLEGVFPGAFEGRLSRERLEGAVPEIEKARVHLCGPPPMMAAMRKFLEELKVPPDQIKTEAFGPASLPQKPPTPASSPTASPSAATLAAPTTVENLKSVTFKRSGKTLPIQSTQSVLELAEQNQIDIPYSCRVGTCGSCKVTLLAGEVEMEVQEGLTEEDRKNHQILACQAKAKSNLEIEEP
jgi:ferredoxin-NADP reductase